MATFRFSAFSDEYSPSLDEQICGLLENNVHLMEPRNVDGTNISDLTSEAALEMRAKLDKAGIGISALGSPIGKIKITDDFETHKIKLRRTCEIAKILGADRIRMFSFFIPKGTEDYSVYRDEVMRRLGEMIDIAEEYGVLLCHENEKGIYGDTPERCLDILKTFPGRIGCVFDTANFLQVGATPFPDGFMLLCDYITYMHVKDCIANGTVVVAGTGIGCVPETFAVLNRRIDGVMNVTVEPHLRVFAGLEALEGGPRTALGNAYATAAEAFAAAAEHLRWCLPKTAHEEQCLRHKRRSVLRCRDWRAHVHARQRHASLRSRQNLLFRG